MLVLAASLVFGLAGCAAPSHVETTELQSVPATAPAGSEGLRVMVIMNANSPESVEIGTYYAKKRGVPRSHLVLLHTSTNEEVSMTTYDAEIDKPAKAALEACADPVDFLVLTKGVPIRVTEGGYSVDGLLGTTEIRDRATKHHADGVGDLTFIENPYYGLNEPFSSRRFGFWLACRLDGYTVDDAKRLVDNSLAAKPSKGPFLFDEAGNRNTSGYDILNKDLGDAAKIMADRSFIVIHDKSDKFVAPDDPLAGYCSWGSNDAAFTPDAYHRLRFLPGALAETFVSTSARTFLPTSGGQSLIADLIAQGVTGIKGYVSEPFVFALARPSILFNRYTSGYTLAESMYMASPTIRWKEVVLGDPLCAPYRH